MVSDTTNYFATNSTSELKKKKKKTGLQWYKWENLVWSDILYLVKRKL